jgi:hypothetical protein
MHPDLEFFLEEAFQSVSPTSSEIGRVVVQPDYEVAPDPKDSGHLASELLQCLRDMTLVPAALKSRDGQSLDISGPSRLLRKYVRGITLHADAVEGDWIEVAPPGNWI